jgi:integral membrane protein (TIGR01906 family)
MKKVYIALSVLITILIPFFLIMGSIRVLLNPFFLDYEYNLPNFPRDDFGFSTADRLYWGKISLNYLTNNAGIEYLADLKFDDGTSFYNDREISHMLDVKNLIQKALIVWYISIAVLIGLFIWSRLKKWTDIFMRGVSRGSLLTFGVIAAVLVGVALNFDELFTQFHHLFFTGDTWLFYVNDSLIRLFPEKLWSDAFLFMGVFTLVGAVLLLLLGMRFLKRRKSN